MEQLVEANGITVNVEIAGDGPAMLLLHGFPHTWQVWSAVIPRLSRTRRVIAPDLRGLGATTRAATGYDGGTVAEDALRLLDALGEQSAEVVALDLGVPAAVLLALRQPGRVRRLVVMEASLPGRDGFTPPWWFGFHAVPGLAETVLTGHEGEYLDFFLRSGTYDGGGIDPEVRDAFVAAYAGKESLWSAFEHYRGMPVTAAQLAAELRTRRLAMPVTAIGARPVGDTLYRQLTPIADDLTGHVIEDCGHIIPLDRPEALLPYLENAVPTTPSSARASAAGDPDFAL
ncbi:alpha/beta hydrolase [Actinoplanes bogorensis]|uniref:Alpha/beta hydrolase n=1 Tax=Paractinoplanes bogorensis TaxID=1610840 RepID=A0ABS5YV86_9ACTN|nr:alpha/beta fold hydrolase [Actinoplanes bogorensis]MBU2667363.1 alpha/beta hydrolase [Actinoplanes bogorensis]